MAGEKRTQQKRASSSSLFTLIFFLINQANDRRLITFYFINYTCPGSAPLRCRNLPINGIPCAESMRRESCAMPVPLSHWFVLFFTFHRLKINKIEYLLPRVPELLPYFRSRNLSNYDAILRPLFEFMWTKPLIVIHYGTREFKVEMFKSRLIILPLYTQVSSYLNWSKRKNYFRLIFGYFDVLISHTCWIYYKNRTFSVLVLSIETQRHLCERQHFGKAIDMSW